MDWKEGGSTMRSLTLHLSFLPCLWLAPLWCWASCSKRLEKGTTMMEARLLGAHTRLSIFSLLTSHSKQDSTLNIPCEYEKRLPMLYQRICPLFTDAREAIQDVIQHSLMSALFILSFAHSLLCKMFFLKQRSVFGLLEKALITCLSEEWFYFNNFNAGG